MSERDGRAASDSGAGPAQGSELLALASGVARVAAVAWWHVAGWTASAAVAGTTYVAKRAAQGQSTGAILHDAAGDLRSLARRALQVEATGGIVDADRLVSSEDVRRTGAELIRRSSEVPGSGDVPGAEQVHPAFARILTEITPDETRILRLLLWDGPQPSVDVRTRGALGTSSQRVAAGLTMVAERAGCRYAERGRLYLANLARLALVEFSDERVGDPDRYQVVEAQPAVAAAVHQAGRSAKTVQRSVVLTEFGAEFARSALPIEAPAAPSVTSDQPPDR